jgi:hypothetical protein
MKNKVIDIKEGKKEETGNFSLDIWFDEGVLKTFIDIIGYQINTHWVAVSTKEGKTFAYPAANIAELIHYPTSIQKAE